MPDKYNKFCPLEQRIENVEKSLPPVDETPAMPLVKPPKED